MEPWKVILLILVILLLVYVTAVFIVLTYAFEFRKKLHNRLDTLSIILLAKKDSLIQLASLYEQNGIELTFDDLDKLSNIKGVTLEKREAAKVRDFNKELNYLEQRLYFLALYNEKIKDTIEYKKILTALKETNNLFAKCSVAYNYDVLGYNYWSSINFAFLICYLLRFRKKEVIS